jgi:hypothetical protein
VECRRNVALSQPIKNAIIGGFSPGLASATRVVKFKTHESLGIDTSPFHYDPSVGHSSIRLRTLS